MLGTAIVQVFDLQVGVTGLNEKTLRRTATPYRAIHTHPMSHADYYPGARQLALKLLVDPDSDLILGAQAVGASGVDKRIDVIATATSMAGAQWQMATPGPELEAVYRSDPRLRHAIVEVGPRLTRVLTALLAGMDTDA